MRSFLMLLLVLIAAVPAGAQDAPDDELQIHSLLAWVADGAAPGDHNPDAPGELALINSLGVQTPVMDLPAGTDTVIPCGERATSPGGAAFAFYVGDAVEGQLYVMRGQQTPSEIDTVPRAACLDGGTFRFSPDGERFAYIDYAPRGDSRYTAGRLNVYETATSNLLYEIDNTTAFALSDEQVAAARLFVGGGDAGEEAAVWIWDGTRGSEVATLLPSGDDNDGCAFVSASLAFVDDGNLSLVMGQRCERTRQSSWQLYQVIPDEERVTLVSSEDIIGSFLTYARTNRQFVPPAGDVTVFTVPDGVVANTASLFAVGQDDLEIQPLLERQAVMPADNRPVNATPRQSPNGQWLALTETSPDNNNTIVVYDLNDLSLAPIQFSAGSSGNVVVSMGFSDDSEQLYAVVGGTDQGDNSVVSITLSSGGDNRAERGQFNERLAVEPDGLLHNGLLALNDWQFPDDPTEDPYLDLVLMNADTNTSHTVFTGAVVEGDEIVQRRFAAPLAWR